MLKKIKSELLNFGLKFISIDDKIVRMILETAPSNLNEIVILPAVKMVMKKLIKKLQNKIVHGRVYNGMLNGVRVSIIRSQIGCPNVGLVVESLKRCKTKIIIRIDLCGGIQDETNEIDIGTIIIPKSAYCDDGTTPQYIRTYPALSNKLESVENPLSILHNLLTGNKTVFISKPNEILKEILLKEGLSTLTKNKIKEVNLWTTDALFCETYEFIRAIKAANINAIDMESSILFLLGELFNLKTVSILSVSDLPGHPQYDLLKSNEIHPNMGKGIEDTIKIVIESLPRIKSVLIDT